MNKTTLRIIIAVIPVVIAVLLLIYSNIDKSHQPVDPFDLPMADDTRGKLLMIKCIQTYLPSCYNVYEKYNNMTAYEKMHQAYEDILILFKNKDDKTNSSVSDSINFLLVDDIENVVVIGIAAGTHTDGEIQQFNTTLHEIYEDVTFSVGEMSFGWD